MAWAYSSWVAQSCAEARWTVFLQHYQEVTDAISAKVQSDGTMIDPTTVMEYFKELQKIKKEIDVGGDLGHGAGSRITRGRILKL